MVVDHNTILATLIFQVAPHQGSLPRPRLLAAPAAWLTLPPSAS